MISRESEGSFQYGNYHREVEDLRSVIEYFTGVKRTIIAILGHSKGVPTSAQNLDFNEILILIFYDPDNSHNMSHTALKLNETFLDTRIVKPQQP